LKKTTNKAAAFNCQEKLSALKTLKEADIRKKTRTDAGFFMVRFGCYSRETKDNRQAEIVNPPSYQRTAADKSSKRQSIKPASLAEAGRQP
jgi:hypothetical protein